MARCGRMERLFQRKFRAQAAPRERTHLSERAAAQCEINLSFRAERGILVVLARTAVPLKATPRSLALLGMTNKDLFCHSREALRCNRSCGCASFHEAQPSPQDDIILF
jgi:hypothetical protein